MALLDTTNLAQSREGAKEKTVFFVAEEVQSFRKYSTNSILANRSLVSSKMSQHLNMYCIDIRTYDCGNVKLESYFYLHDVFHV